MIDEPSVSSRVTDVPRWNVARAVGTPPQGRARTAAGRRSVGRVVDRAGEPPLPSPAPVRV